MPIAGQIESLWRYPVKSMAGEELQAAFVGFAGIYGDRIYAVGSAAAPKGFPYLTAREQPQMLLCRPKFRDAGIMARPGNLAEAEAIGSGVTPVYADETERGLDVLTPAGEQLAIDDPRLLDLLGGGLRDGRALRLLRSDRAMTDCRPVSLFSLQTVRQLAEESGVAMDKRRFRANIYVDLASQAGFGEDEFVGRTLRIGENVLIAVLARDARCKLITLDPETGLANPEIMRQLAASHESKAGVYAAVLVEGTIRPGDAITIVS